MTREEERDIAAQAREEQRRDRALSYPSRRTPKPLSPDVETLEWAADVIEHNRFMQSVSDCKSNYYEPASVALQARAAAKPIAFLLLIP